MQVELVRLQSEDKSRQRLHHPNHHNIIISSKYPKFKARDKALKSYLSPFSHHKILIKAYSIKISSYRDHQVVKCFWNSVSLQKWLASLTLLLSAINICHVYSSHNAHYSRYSNFNACREIRNRVLKNVYYV